MAQPPTASSLDLLIVGAGFGGLCMLHKARAPWACRRRCSRPRPASAAPGTTTAIPGARVDIQSMEYSFSFSEALQQEWRWTERYAAQPELLRYANHVADRFGLRDGIRLNTRVTGAALRRGRQPLARAHRRAASDGRRASW